MSSKLDTSLDDILKTRRQTKGQGRGRGGRRSDAARPAPSGPVGGVGKSAKPARQPKAAPAAAAVIPETNGKILVSGLPHDVDQNALQEYFAQAVNIKPKKVLLQYGPTGRSLGSATIIFHKHEQAVKATGTLNGVKIDNRPIRVEMLVSAANLSATAAPSLAERVTQPKKDKPKPANAAKTAPVAAGKGRGRGGRAEARGGRGGRNPRERTKKKTVEELDAEMADYFPAGESNTDVAATGAADVVQTTTAVGDTAMDDEML